ncbi:MAG: galactokinase [Candidatus Adiutrix sp.]|jgi:galactokinase|nr:galactokinase [Candidatus Adiutrix sp.]
MTIMTALSAKFKKIYGRDDGELFFAPGRVNLIGEHTDYNGGHVLPCALQLGTYALAAPRDDRMVHLHSLNYDDRGVIQADLPSLYRLREYDWAIYPLGVMDALKKEGVDLPGADIVFFGDLPPEAGLSSSASIEVLTAVIMNELFRLDYSPADLARVSRQAENNFVGLASGPMDQMSVALGRKDHALLLDCATLDFRCVPLRLAGCSLVIGNTNKRRALTGSKYNERRAECDAALAVLQTRRDVDLLCDLSPEDLRNFAPVLTNPIQLKRARHAITENQRVLDAVRALENGETEVFGRLMSESHASLRDDYEVTGTELDTFVDLALGCPGVLGSRMTGAGFGGCTVSLVKDEFVERFKAEVGEGYTKAIGYAPSFYPAVPSRGAGRLAE